MHFDIRKKMCSRKKLWLKPKSDQCDSLYVKDDPTRELKYGNEVVVFVFENKYVISVHFAEANG